MNGWYVVIFLWAVIAVSMYRRSAHILDELKEENPDTNPVFYDIACIVIILFWPLTIPQTIKKFIQKLKERDS